MATQLMMGPYLNHMFSLDTSQQLSISCPLCRVLSLRAASVSAEVHRRQGKHEICHRKLLKSYRFSKRKRNLHAARGEPLSNATYREPTTYELQALMSGVLFFFFSLIFCRVKNKVEHKILCHCLLFSANMLCSCED